MKKLISILILLSFASPVRAGLVTEFEPPKEIIKQGQPWGDVSQPPEPTPPLQPKWWEETWFKWTLGIVVVGGIAAAAGGKSGGGGSSPSSNGGATVTGSW